MAVVKIPFMSIWASGTLNKTITCKPMGYNKFVMGKYSRFNYKLGYVQQKWSEEFTRRAKLMKLYLDNLDLAVEVDSLTNIIP